MCTVRHGNKKSDSFRIRVSLLSEFAQLQPQMEGWSQVCKKEFSIFSLTNYPVWICDPNQHAYLTDDSLPRHTRCCVQSYTAPCRYSARNLLKTSGLYPVRPAGTCRETHNRQSEPVSLSSNDSYQWAKFQEKTNGKSIFILTSKNDKWIMCSRHLKTAHAVLRLLSPLKRSHTQLHFSSMTKQL